MKKCIICKKIKNSNDFNKEHVIPESIGGSLTIDNVCKACNSKLGKEIDSKITNDFLIKGNTVKNKIKNKKNKEKVLFEKLTSNKNPKIKIRAKRGKNGKFENWESNTSLKPSPDNKSIHSIYYDPNKDKETVLKDIEKLFKNKYKKILTEEEKKEIVYKMNNEYTYPEIEFNFNSTIDFKKIAREFNKIAYETAHYILGKKYFDDEIGQDLRESLFDENHELIEKYAKRGMGLISNPKFKDIFNFINQLSEKKLIHLIVIYVINNKIYLVINLFNIYINCICITETVNVYNFNELIYFILFYHENNEKTFDEMNELDLLKGISKFLMNKKSPPKFKFI